MGTQLSPQMARDLAVKRIYAAEGRTIKALEFVAAYGNEADQKTGLVFLGHLKTIRDKWPKLSQTVDSGSVLEAVDAVQQLANLAALAEGLADNSEALAKSCEPEPLTRPTEGSKDYLPPGKPQRTSELDIGIRELTGGRVALAKSHVGPILAAGLVVAGLFYALR